MAISGTAVGVALVGAVLTYSGVKGAKITDTIRTLIASGPSKTGPQIPYQQSTMGGGGTMGQAFTALPAMASGNAATNQANARLQAAAYGWSTGNDWASLVSLWDRESGWSNTADTRSTGAGGDSSGSSVFAYGIAQARPATKYPKPGQPPDLGGIASATVQIAWGLQYIKSRYGSPSAAWQHELANSWY